MNRTAAILGVRVSFLSEQETLERMRQFIEGRGPHQVVTVNPEILVEAARNRPYRELLQRADLATADGAGIIFAARFLGAPVSLRHRITGVTLTHALLALAQQQRKQVAIVIGSEGLSSRDEVSRAVSEYYPDLLFTVVSELEAGDMIARAKPEILFAALGAPQQEFYVAEKLASLPGLRIGIGVGGTFDYISGTIKRAPKLFRAMGLEWLWRLFMQPRRFRRILRAVVVFPYLMLRHR